MKKGFLMLILTFTMACVTVLALPDESISVIAESLANTNKAVEQYYKETILQKNGTGTGEDSKTFGGLVPYGSGSISLGTYDMTATSSLSAPLFTVLPQKEWKTTAATADADNMFFYVDLTSGSKIFTFRFAKATRTDANYDAVFMGTSTYTAGQSNNIWQSKTVYPYTVLPFRYDGTVTDADIANETGAKITVPQEIGFYYNAGHYYMDTVQKSIATNENVRKETATGSGIYRYDMNVNVSYAFTADELSAVNVSVRFDKGTVLKEEAWVMFTSIGGDNFKHKVRYETFSGHITSTDYKTEYSPTDVSISKLPTNVEKDYYTFSHWYYGNNLESKVNEEGFSEWLEAAEGDITLYAYYIPEDKNVEYNLNYTAAPSVESDKIDYINYLEYELKTVDYDLYPDGYIFDGWWTQASGGEKITEISELKNQTLFAHWTVGNLVTFNYGNGDESLIVAVKNGEKVSAPTNPERMGYGFDKWKKDGIAYDFYTIITTETTLDASWTANKYKLVYYVDGVKIDEYTVEYMQTVGQVKSSLPVIPEKEGRESGEWISSGDKIGLDTVVVDNMSIVAVYEKKTYTITYDTNGGNEIESASVEHGERIDGSTLTATKVGCEFIGWKNGGQEFNFSMPITQNLVLIAEWRIKTYDVVIVKNGKQLVTVQKKYGEKITSNEIQAITKNDTDKAYIDASLTEEYDTATAVARSMTLYIPNNESKFNLVLFLEIAMSVSAVVFTTCAVVLVVIKRKRGKRDDIEK